MNYFFHDAESGRLLHIGRLKQHCGFELHVEPGERNHPKNIEDWIKLWATSEAGWLEDEEGSGITVNAMIGLITLRIGSSAYADAYSNAGDLVWDKALSLWMRSGKEEKHQEQSSLVRTVGRYQEVAGYFR